MRRKIGFLAITLLLLVSAFSMLGVAPLQQGGGVPPSPFYADYFSGSVFLRSEPAPAGIQLVACVDDCSVFQSKAMVLGRDGKFNLMSVNPEDRRLRGRDITFYIVNEYGRIQATETRVFEGAYNIRSLDLHFADPLPMPPVPPALPQVGDPLVPQLPKLMLASGSAAVVAGVCLVFLRARREKSY